MNKSIYLASILAAFLLAGTVAGVVPVFADDDEGGRENEEDDDEGGRENEEDDDEGGRENEEDDDDSEGGVIGGLSGLVLYGVIAAVLGTIGYTAYKIFAGRKKTSVQARP